ncbi:MAG: hypothetical protein NZN28_07930 [Meiothermus sp.]|nr:hypothetical protein [Meiothermus sp.]
MPEHPFHPRARSYWEGTGAVGLVRVTALGLLRLLTNPKVMDGKPIGLGEAWRIYPSLVRIHPIAKAGGLPANVF